MSTPHVSVIMASFLGEYPGCASDRISKFSRAVDSFVRNTLEDKELIIVADNCLITQEIYKEKYSRNPYIRFHNFNKKQPLFSGSLRSKGIELAQGKLICYLDTDDFIGVPHIEVLRNAMNNNNFDWAYYNDYLYLGPKKDSTTTNTQMRETGFFKGKIGTSSICHFKDLNVNWDDCDGYGHDWKFVNKLMEASKNYGKIYGPSYNVCHSPKLFDTPYLNKR